MTKIIVNTHSRSEMIDITKDVEEIVRQTAVVDGICHVFVPHTTAAVTINENADPDVPSDILSALDKSIPWRDNYRHIEGNSAAHIKSSLFGATESIIIENGRLVLGTWQSLFFCEFDGPRTRKVCVQIISS